MNIPPTPNLQKYKLHGHKTKKKTCAYTQNFHHSPIPPKQQPIIISPAINHHKSPRATTNDHNPPKSTLDKNNRYNLTRKEESKNTNYHERVQDNPIVVHFDQERNYKKESIQEFMEKVVDLRDRINNIKSFEQQRLEQQQRNFENHFEFIEQTFKQLQLEIVEKQKELKNNLIEMIGKRREDIDNTAIILNNIKDNLERYVFDINKHYEDIIQELQLSKFQQIIDQYHAKIDYYDNSINIKKNPFKKCLLYEEINLYLPVQELKRVIEKANVSYYQKQNIISQNKPEKLKGSTSQRFNKIGIIKSSQDQKGKYNKHPRKTHGTKFRDSQYDPMSIGHTINYCQ